jgi:hypothetical protein
MSADAENRDLVSVSSERAARNRSHANRCCKGHASLAAVAAHDLREMAREDLVMQSFNLSMPSVGFLVGTRAALAFGLGLLAASRIPEARRTRIGLALLGVGAATTVPAIRMLRRHRSTPAMNVNGAAAEFGFARPL